jgi:hypothetical protein
MGQAEQRLHIRRERRILPCTEANAAHKGVDVDVHIDIHVGAQLSEDIVKILVIASHLADHRECLSEIARHVGVPPERQGLAFGSDRVRDVQQAPPRGKLGTRHSLRV